MKEKQYSMKCRHCNNELKYEFLDLGVVKKQKISKDLKSRKIFLSEYKSTILKFNSEFKKNKDKLLYDSIERKD